MCVKEEDSVTWISQLFLQYQVTAHIHFPFPKAVAMVTFGTGTLTDAVRMIMWLMSEK